MTTVLSLPVGLTYYITYVCCGVDLIFILFPKENSTLFVYDMQCLRSNPLHHLRKVCNLSAFFNAANPNRGASKISQVHITVIYVNLKLFL